MWMKMDHQDTDTLSDSYQRPQPSSQKNTLPKHAIALP